MREMLRGVVEQVGAAVAAGATLDEVRESVDLSPWRASLAGDDEVAQRAFDSFVPELAERAWLDARGELE